jgi:hypothetical protein
MFSEGRSPGETVRRPAQHGPLDRLGDGVERAAQVPQLDGQQKIEIVLAGLRGDRSAKQVCREHEISNSRRDKLLIGLTPASVAVSTKPGQLQYQLLADDADESRDTKAQ